MIRRRPIRPVRSRPIPQLRNPVPRQASKKAMKLYQGFAQLNCLQPDSSVWNPVDLMAGIHQGTGAGDRLGQKIRVYRIDVFAYIENNPLQVIPEEQVQLIMYRTKQLLQGNAPDNFSQLMVRPVGQIATIGPVPSAGGTDGAWLPRTWVINPSFYGQGKIMSIKNFTVYQQGSILAAGTTVPNVSAISTALSANINSRHRFRHWGKYSYNFKKGMNVQYRDAGDPDINTATFIWPARNAVDNHVWLTAVGETLPGFTQAFQLSWNVWYSDT